MPALDTIDGLGEKAADLMHSIPDDVLAANPEMAYHAAMIYKAQADEKSAQHYFEMACPGQTQSKCLKKWGK